jgi:hypothetical protein
MSTSAPADSEGRHPSADELFDAGTNGRMRSECNPLPGRQVSRPAPRIILKPVQVNHSPSFAPVPEPTIKTGVRAMSLAVLNALQ